MSEPKKLIEVAMPIKEISAESVRDKSIRSGHISTLHLWWARRPLPVCRAVVFASLVPDPLDQDCPQQFKEAVEFLLGSENNIGDPFKPYDDIPYTSAIDKMDDNLRHRLMMFIGKFSETYIKNEKQGKVTVSKQLISNNCLIKSESKKDEKTLQIARKLIWISHNSKRGLSLKELISEFENYVTKIHNAESALYNKIDRHIFNPGITQLELELEAVKTDFLNNMPKVFDPFAGGGAIPLEAARLWCRSYGNDINPVAHVIQKASLVYPQTFGKPITFSKNNFIDYYGQINWDKHEYKNYVNGEAESATINNRLAFDVEFYSKLILENTKKKINQYYEINGTSQIQAYYWVKSCTCSNPSCKTVIPMLKQFYLSQRRSAKEKDWVYLEPQINGKEISFNIKKGRYDQIGWNNRGNILCPVCKNTTDIKEIKRQSVNHLLGEQMVAVIEDGIDGRIFRVPFKEEIELLNGIPEQEVPQEKMQKNSAGGDTLSWGITKWGEIYSKRQLLFMHSIINEIKKLSNDLLDFEHDYKTALFTYLSFLVNRVAMRNNKHARWHLQQDTIENIFGRQAISMIFDYPEMNPFSTFTSSAANQISQIVDYINEESNNFNSVICNNAASGDIKQFEVKYLDSVVTDPPYYDAIAYADLSDFFYLWLKRSLNNFYPGVFATPQTPKAEECTALKHHHDNNIEKAKSHFENKLKDIFRVIETQTSGVVSIMFAHQSTEAWSTLCNSILNANMNITGSWAIDTESTTGLKSDKAYLSSSVTVSCMPYTKSGMGDFQIVKKAIENTVEEEVKQLYKLGFRGADLLTACFGQAVSEFGRYEKVEKADGSDVSVNELLEIARESAFNSLLKGFDGDDFTKFYIGWLQLNGLVDNDFDDAAKFTKVGLSIDVQDLFKEHILLKNGNKQHLGSYKERINSNNRLGEGRNNSIIDQTHRLMHLYSSPNRNNLLKYIEANSFEAESPVWRVLTSLAELLPKDIEDHKLAVGLLTNKDQLIREAKSSNTPKPEQSKLILE
jgi:putative DNA methylase